MRLKIGELARKTGLSIRTLRHYDELGLLSPGERTERGHRLYSPADFARLLQVQGLKSLGLRLDDIRVMLSDPDCDSGAILSRHIQQVERQVQEQQRLLQRLRAVASRQAVSASELLEVIRMSEKIREKVASIMEVARSVGGDDQSRFDAEQQAYLAQQAETLGQTRIEEVQNAWPTLMAEVLTEMERGTDPKDPAVRALGLRWRTLVQEFSGGRPDIERTLSDAYQGRMTPEMQAMWDYIAKAMT
ncbi:MerR family transcriptional regulator [Deinococcus ruber]|uniref:MerR family transcriptional regulator n=1 Tax=Deinococcus ruber TaxID=1848197 RepID=A0A918C6C0_9DEIO|nr:MerR family transcriptional regulator [Deinococcus ruber]GGR07890.1 MerR family transcriptional regulator [Deinococcus ruber]